MRTGKAAAAALLLGAVWAVPVMGADEMAEGFKHPGRDARPWTWWHWVSGNVSKEGITADLEAMNRIGLGGAQAFSVDQGPKPDKPVLYMSQEWRDMMKHAVQESARLNLALTMHACEGWSESGGPWIKPEQSMQKVVWTQAAVKGPGRVEVAMPRPEATDGQFSDIAVLAFPKRVGDEVTMAALRPSVRASGGTDASAAADGDANTQVTVKPDPGGRGFVECRFDRPASVGSVAISSLSAGTKCELQVSEDGKTFRTIGTFTATSRPKGRQVAYLTPAASVRAVRAVVPKMAEGKPWTIGEIEVAGPRVPDFVARSGMAVNLHLAPMPADVPADQVIPADGVVDLTGHMGQDGRLTWDAPAGEWTILRLASTSTGVTNHPTMEETRGLECDKLDRKVVATQFNHTVGQVVEDASPLVGNKGLGWALLDSWEAGCQNWTPMFREEFIGKRHYDPCPWMPALTGRIVGSPELTERFLWDYRLTIAELLAENHYGLFADLLHQNGMKLMSEAVGIGMPTIADQLQCKGRTDVPMGEFWVERESRDYDPKEAASAAHIYGQNVAAAESFTARPDAAGWKNDPASLKALGDKMFTLGINHFVFHRYAHQPYLDRVPGVTMGPWGINFERTNTWWEPAHAWIEYITRCQYLLKRGRFVADVCYYYGEGAPIGLQMDALKPEPPAGYDYDACNREILLTTMTVDHGDVVLPTGMRYRVLVLPDTDRMTPEVARKVRELASAGATVVGPRPVRSPSFEGYPGCDREVARIGDEVWGDCDGKGVTEHPFGKGRVIWGRKLTDVLGVKPDFESGTPDVRYIHRHDADADLYFVSNQAREGRVVDCTFRVAGRQPELWWPDSGRMERAAMWSGRDGRTTVRLPLEAAGSVFVVFRDKAGRAGFADVRQNGQSIFAGTTHEAPGGKLEIKRAQYGAIEEGGKVRDVTDRLAARASGGRLDLVVGNAALGGDPAHLQHKQLRVEYVLNGRPGEIVLPEGQELRLPPTPESRPDALDLPAEFEGGKLVVWRPGTFEVVSNSGGSRAVAAKQISGPVGVAGPWDVRFQSGRGAPESARFDRLLSWTERSEEGVKYFSGTATYATDFDVPADALGARAHARLDLGDVKNLAAVTLNGKDLGVLWKPPFTVDATGAIKSGKNHLEVAVTNLWVNRLIGDQFVDESKRVTWTTYNPYKKDSPLVPSGLLGPVRVEFGSEVKLPQ